MHSPTLSPALFMLNCLLHLVGLKKKQEREKRIQDKEI